MHSTAKTNRLKRALLTFLILPLGLCIASAGDTKEDEGPSPEGCYRLGLIIPKKLNQAQVDETGWPTHELVCSDKEICLKSEDVKKGEPDSVSSGKYTITIRDGDKPVVTYLLKYSKTDGSGSHVDHVFAETEADLKDVSPEDYARGNHAPFEKVIFYILAWPELKGGKPLQAGDYAGTVTINAFKYALFKK